MGHGSTTGQRQKSIRHPLPNRGRTSYVGGVRPLSSIPRRLTAARAALLWERLWSGLWPAVTLAGLFGALALSDLLPRLPGWLHAAILGLFGLAVLAALIVGLRPVRWPTMAEAAHRLERPVLHRPLTASRDSLAQGGDDPLSRALWEAHARRAAAEAAALRGVVPHPGVPARDPRGLRSLAVLALFVTVIAAWNDPWPRVSRALSPSLSGGAARVLTADVWVTPPEYTGQAPFYRTGVAAGTGDPLSIEAPEGSRLLLLIHGADSPVVRLGAVYETPHALADDSHRLEAALVPTTEATDSLAVMEGGRILAEWPLRVAPDAAPRVAFAAPPGEGARWRLRLPFEAADDHGLAGLDLTVGRDGATETFDVPLPPGQPATAAGQPLIDLTAHPWAGLPVTVHLTVRDALGQNGQTEALPITLPERVFTHPVAQELADQRKTVLHEPDQRFAVAAMLDAIASRPGAFDGDAVVFLALRVASARLRHVRSASTGPQTDVAELLWQAALRIEDGALAAAEERLAEAERALEQALEDDADPEEIKRLVEDLKQALAEFMQALMENMPEMALQDMPNITLPQDVIDPADMARMLDQLGEMSEIGAQEAARQMMEQLREMLQALRNAQPMPSQQAQEMQEIMNALRDLARRQEELLNETFRNSREETGEDSQRGRRTQQPPQNQPPQNRPPRNQRSTPPDPAAGAALAEDQEALRQALGDIMNRIGEQAGQVPENLGAAELDMRQASDALAGQSWAPAEEAQGRALDALRQGAGEAMQQMMQAMMQRGGQQGQGMMMPFGQQPGQSMDPMGRGFGGMQTEGTEIPTEPDTRRARDILMELRRRSNDIDRPSEERDYLRRLLRQF